MCSRIFCLVLGYGSLVSVSAAQSITDIKPRIIHPGSPARLTISGKDFGDPLRAISSIPADVQIESVQADKVEILLSLPTQASLGPMGLWIATGQGPSEPFVLLVDDLNASDEISGNHSREAAQAISPPAAVVGISDGAQSDFYRFRADAGQRVAIEVLTQDLGSTMDPFVRLLDQQGNQLYLADDDEVGPEPRFSYRFDQAGEYLIEVRDNQFAAGGAYHLRVGDFPCFANSFPLAVRRGSATSVEFDSMDESHPLAAEVSIPDLLAAESFPVSTRLPDGQSSAWTRLYVTDLPLLLESQATSEPIDLPVAINGRLGSTGERDSYTIRGIEGATFRFRSRTRSLRSRALLRMQLFKADGSRVVQTEVTDADEWSFDYTFPDAGEYRLEVSDLLSRGGTGFGYLVEASPNGTFAIARKPDAKSREHFAIEEGRGACAVDLQITRFGYDGEILLSLDPPDAGLSILNPVVPASAKEARVFVVAGGDWKPDGSAMLRIQGEAKDNASVRSGVTSLELHRVKRPHVPFPQGWSDGVLFVSGRGKTEDAFTIEPQVPLLFARPLATHGATLTLKRTDEKSKDPVELIANPSFEGWSFAVKSEGDSFHTTWTQADPHHEPDRLSLFAFSESSGAGRIAPVEFPVRWMDPIRIRPQSNGPWIAGKANVLDFAIDREGNDPQPAELRFTVLPDGWTAPDTLTIAADATQGTFEMMIPSAWRDTSAKIGYELTSKYQGAEFKTSGTIQVASIVPVPDRLAVHPSEIMLDGESSRRQLVVTGYDPSGAIRDWTRDVIFRSSAPDVAEVIDGIVHAKSNGDAEVAVEIGDRRLVIPVHVRDAENERRTQFESDVLVALSKQGCNSGACHGSPSGKGMFRLSLRAFDRQLDELTLIREDFGRRINRVEPEKSLLLLKPLMKVSHGGGKKLHEEDPAYAILRDWIRDGALPDPPETPRCIRLEVYPSEKRVLALDGGGQQLSVLAHFEDGRTKDVTDLVVYESSSTTVASVNERGMVTPAARGESVILVRFLEHIESVPLMFIKNDPEFKWAAPPPSNYIDELVFAKLKQLEFLPAPTCDDAEFLRRAYLDVIGILPTVEESKEFLADDSQDKRSRLIDQLLQRDEYAKFWALKWGDLLKMTGKVVGDQGVYKYHRWVEESFRTNMPYDEFVRELLAAKGSTLANPPANFFRTSSDMNECVETVSQVFLGARLQCAKCHNHPFERWTQDNYYGLGAFFNRLQRRSTQRPGEMFIWTADSGEVTHPRTGKQMKPWLPGFGELETSSLEDRRDALVNWLVNPDNPYFARIEANRIWAQCFSRGIVEPIDDFRDSNPPSNSALLDALAEDFAASGFDRKHLLRTILNSRTYQASYEANDLNRDDVMYFSHQRPRMLSAEQLLDAVNHVTGVDQQLGNLPADTKATQLPAPDLVKVDFLKVFGQPERSTVCACERSDSSNLGMAIELFNGTTIHEKLRNESNRFRKAVAAGQSVEDTLRELYFAALCRAPSEAELQAAVEHCRQREEMADGLEDVCWALLNTDEFLFQH